MNLQLQLPFELEPFRQQLENTVKPHLAIIPQKASFTTLWESKVGGAPYLPLDASFPINQEGKPLYFLAQINCSEIPPLFPFPNTGILQFYINDENAYGLDFSRPFDQNNFRVLYFETIETDENALTTDFSFLNDRNYSDLPINPNFSFPLIFEARRAIIPQGDYRFEELIGFDFFSAFGSDQASYWKAYRQLSNAKGHKIGGYPSFCQEDPRYDLETTYELLFQLDSDSDLELMWGDMGVANFFISSEDLKKRDFSKAMYNWDCY